MFEPSALVFLSVPTLSKLTMKTQSSIGVELSDTFMVLKESDCFAARRKTFSKNHPCIFLRGDVLRGLLVVQYNWNGLVAIC